MCAMEASPDIRYVDMESALARVRGNKKLYRRMLGLFLDGKEFSALEEALAQGDWAKAGDVAHAIKGITGNLSLPALFETSTQLMAELRQGPAARETIDSYRDAYEKTRVSVEDVTRAIDAETT